MDSVHTVVLHMYSNNNQGLIKPPKAARGHAMHVHGKILNVTKNKCT